MFWLTDLYRKQFTLEQRHNLEHMRKMGWLTAVQVFVRQQTSNQTWQWRFINSFTYLLTYLLTIDSNINMTTMIIVVIVIVTWECLHHWASSVPWMLWTLPHKDRRCSAWCRDRHTAPSMSVDILSNSRCWSLGQRSPCPPHTRPPSRRCETECTSQPGWPLSCHTAAAELYPEHIQHNAPDSLNVIVCKIYLLPAPTDIIWAVMIVWRIKGKIIRTVQCCTVYHNWGLMMMMMMMMNECTLTWRKSKDCKDT